MTDSIESILEGAETAARWGIEKKGDWKDTCFESSDVPEKMEAKLREMVELLPEIRELLGWAIDVPSEARKAADMFKKLTKWEKGE